jgi:hypothetical protein
VHNKYRYGTPKAPIEKALAEGRTVLLEIDLQGARQVRAAAPDAARVPARRAGTSSSSGSSVAAPKTRRSARAVCAPPRRARLAGRVRLPRRQRRRRPPAPSRRWSPRSRADRMIGCRGSAAPASTRFHRHPILEVHHGRT